MRNQTFAVQVELPKEALSRFASAYLERRTVFPGMWFMEGKTVSMHLDRERMGDLSYLAWFYRLLTEKEPSGVEDYSAAFSSLYVRHYDSPLKFLNWWERGEKSRLDQFAEVFQNDPLNAELLGQPALANVCKALRKQFTYNPEVVKDLSEEESRYFMKVMTTVYRLVDH